MRIGICGAQRTGKTTLANALAERLEYEFIETNVSGFLKEKEIEVCSGLSSQDMVLEHIANRVSGRNDFVSDRTPVDVLMYSRYMQLEDKEHELRCLNDSQDLFDLYILVQPGISVPPEKQNLEWKASYDKAMMEYCNVLAYDILGNNCVNFIVIPVSMTDLDERIEYCVSRLQRAL